MQDGLRRRFLAFELLGNVRFAVDRAAGSQRHDLPFERAADRLLQAQSHPPNLLHEEFPAAGGAFVVGEDVGNSAARQQVNEEGLSPKRDHRVKAPFVSVIFHIPLSLCRHGSDQTLVEEAFDL